MWFIIVVYVQFKSSNQFKIRFPSKSRVRHFLMPFFLSSQNMKKTKMRNKRCTCASLAFHTINMAINIRKYLFQIFFVSFISLISYRDPEYLLPLSVYLRRKKIRQKKKPNEDDAWVVATLIHTTYWNVWIHQPKRNEWKIEINKNKNSVTWIGNMVNKVCDIGISFHTQTCFSLSSIFLFLKIANDFFKFYIFVQCIVCIAIFFLIQR